MVMSGLLCNSKPQYNNNPVRELCKQPQAQFILQPQYTDNHNALTTTMHRQPSEDLWGSHYKCTLKLSSNKQLQVVLSLTD